MGYQLITNRTSPNYSRGRYYPIKFIVIHHWGARGQRFDNVVNWLCRPNGNSSAHYVVQDGIVARIVAEENRAWHAGRGGNPQGIGIECRPEATDGDYQTVAELIADIWRRRGVLPLYPHRHFMNTGCPGVWDLNRLNNLAKQIYTGNTQPKRKKVVDMLYMRDEAGRVYATDGIHARWVGSADIVNKAIAKGVPLIDVNSKDIWADFVVIGMDYVKGASRTRVIQDILTQSKSMEGWVRDNSAVETIKRELADIKGLLNR